VKLTTAMPLGIAVFVSTLMNQAMVRLRHKEITIRRTTGRISSGEFLKGVNCKERIQRWHIAVCSNHCLQTRFYTVGQHITI